MEVTGKGSWEFETKHGSRHVTRKRCGDDDKEMLHPLAEEPRWKRGKVVVVAPGRSSVELEDGRLVCAWNHDLDHPDVCQRSDVEPSMPPARLGENGWPPLEKASAKKPCGGCGRQCTDEEFGCATKQGRNSCCHCRKGRPQVQGSSGEGSSSASCEQRSSVGAQCSSSHVARLVVAGEEMAAPGAEA